MGVRILGVDKYRNQGLSRVSFGIVSLNKNVLPFTYQVFQMSPILLLNVFKLSV